MRDFLAADTANVLAQIANLRTAFPELDEDFVLLQDTLSGETDFERVMERVTEEFMDAVSMKGAIAERLSNLHDRAGRFDRKADAMRSLALNLMRAANQRSITLPEATLSIRNGLKSVVVENADDLPQGFTRTERIALKTEIKKALEAGEFVPGAKLTTGPDSLAIKTK